MKIIFCIWIWKKSHFQLSYYNSNVFFNQNQIRNLIYFLLFESYQSILREFKRTKDENEYAKEFRSKVDF